ncbi:MAG: phage head-tail connector protein [Azospirillaceae bacterium]|nr:phage head-tail connector protein [Azospirillaceae bacterium]
MADFTTLAAARLWANIKGTADDALLSSLITSCSDAMLAYCNRDFFLSQDKTEIRDGTGSPQLTVRNYPLTAVSEVTVNGRPIPAGSVTTPGFYFADTRIVLNGYAFLRGVANVTVAYTAGWATLPPALVQACNELVAFAYKNRDHIGVSSQAGVNQTTSYITAAMPQGVAAILQQYRRVVPV